MMNVNKSVVNTTTGVIIDARPDCPFRTITDLKHYNDDEGSFPPSVVDDEGYEDVNTIINRILRLPRGKGQDLLDQAALAVVDENITDAEADALFDQPDFDLENGDLTEFSDAVDHLAGSVSADFPSVPENQVKDDPEHQDLPAPEDLEQ